MRLLAWLKEFFFGRPVTKEDVLQDRLRLCALSGIKPDEVENFWDGIEELRPPRQSLER